VERAAAHLFLEVLRALVSTLQSRNAKTRPV
jgi:hypothetical protein